MLSTKTILSQFHLFNQNNLRNGAIESNAISNVIVDEGVIMGRMNFQSFRPTLFVEDDNIAEMLCDCGVNYCEHLAALLIALYKQPPGASPDSKSGSLRGGKPKVKSQTSPGFINEFRKIHKPDSVLSVDKAELDFYYGDDEEYDISIFSNNNEQLNFHLEENDDYFNVQDDPILVELKWMDGDLYVRCDECDEESDYFCVHQKLVFLQGFTLVKELVAKKLDIESYYPKFETVKSFPPAFLKKHFHVLIEPDNQVFLRGRSNMELVSAKLIGDLERRLHPFMGDSNDQDSMVSNIFTEREVTTGNAILWSLNKTGILINYLEGKPSKNGKKLISHIQKTKQPRAIPFSIQYDLRKITTKFSELNYNQRQLMIQKDLNFFHKNIDRLNAYIHYLNMRPQYDYDQRISKSNLRQFSFAEYSATVRMSIETEQDILTVKLTCDQLPGNKKNVYQYFLPHFMVIDKTAYVYKTGAINVLFKEENQEIKYVFATQDLDTLRRGISQIVNHYGIDISDLDDDWVKSIPVKKRIIRLSQSGNRITFTPVLEDSGGDNSFNLYTEACIPATEEPFVVNIPDQKRKAQFLEWFEELHPGMDDLTGPLGFHTMDSGDFVRDHWFLDFSDLCEKEGIAVTGWDDLQSFSFNPARGEIEQEITEGPDWFDLKFVIRYGDIIVPQKDWIRAVRKGERSILLKDGSYGIIPEEWRLRMIRLLNSGEVTKDTIQLSRLHFNTLDQYVDLSNDPDIVKEIESKKKRLIHFNGMKSFAMPESIRAELRSYQKDGFQWLKFLNEYGFGGCLADDMGLGKTIQVLSLLADQKGKGHPASLVVVPRSLVHNWVDEIEKFCPDMTYYIHHGAQRYSRTEEFGSYDLIISTYGTITNDIKWIKNYNFHYIILDESQAIKNPSSLRYRSMIQLSGQHRLTMTGTPIENSTMDLFAQFNFINPGLLGNKTHFRKQFSDPIEKTGDDEIKDLLQRTIHPFILRRTKKQVTKELPPKTESILYCEMEGEQKKIYHQVRNEIRASLLAEDQLEKNKIKVLEGLLKLRQICNSPALLPANGLKISKNPPSVKIDMLMEQINEVVTQENHSILVFSQFTSMLALVRKRLDEADYPYAYLDGSTTNRKAVIEEFNSDPDKNIFLLSLKAGNVGLNLTKADFVYLLDPWWNPAVESQAIDRTHRIGQTQPVFAYRMICKDTIEEKIMRLQSRKNKLAEDLIQTDENVFKSLDKAELISLFE